MAKWLSVDTLNLQVPGCCTIDDLSPVLGGSVVIGENRVLDDGTVIEYPRFPTETEVSLRLKLYGRKSFAGAVHPNQAEGFEANLAAIHAGLLADPGSVRTATLHLDSGTELTKPVQVQPPLDLVWNEQSTSEWPQYRAVLRLLFTEGLFVIPRAGAVTITLDVYDVANTGKLGTLSQSHEVGFTAAVRVPGALMLTLDVASADRALLVDQRVIRVNVDGTDIEAYVVQDKPSELVVVGGIPTVTYQCRHLLTWLGHSTGGAVLGPYGWLDGLQQSPRWFGPMGFDFPTLAGIPEPTTDGPLTRENWVDRRAERFVFNTRAVYRRLLTGDGGPVRPARMWFTSAAWTIVRVWFDGAELPTLSTFLGDRTIRQLDLPYDGEDHVICFDCEGTPPPGLQNSLGWTWALLEADDVGEYNSWGTMEGRLFTTFNSTTYTGPTPPTAPFWQAWEDYADGGYPGVTVGRVGDTAVTEAQTRGALPSVVTDFDELVDSGGNAWQHEFARAFRPQLVGHLLDSLEAFGCEPEMTPANVLRIHQVRGTDRTATITLSAPFALSSTGRGVMATRYLTETDGGFGEVIDAAAEIAWGVTLEQYAALGEDMHPHTVADALVLQLAGDASTYSELEVAMPADVVPYVDVFLGDRVLCQSDADGTISTVRIMSFRAELLPGKRTEWFATVEPYA